MHACACALQIIYILFLLTLMLLLTLLLLLLLLFGMCENRGAHVGTLEHDKTFESCARASIVFDDADDHLISAIFGT